MEDIYEWLENHAKLTEEELGTSPYRGRPWFKHSVRSSISNMVKSGKIKRVGRGLYRLP